LHLHGHPSFLRISPRGIDDLGQAVAGLFVDASGDQHGFVQFKLPDQPDRVVVIDYPASGSQTALEDINQIGNMPGQWLDELGNPHAFVLTMSQGVSTFVDLNPNDGSAYQQAWGVNDHGLIALSTNAGQSYVYCPKKNPEKCPASGLYVDDRVMRLSDGNRSRSYTESARRRIYVSPKRLGVLQ
jgi:hypothetical protein